MNERQSNCPIDRGQRIFTCGHSFHFWVPGLLAEMARAAGIVGHQTIGTSAIGGSRAIQHWDVPEEQNKAKQALRAGTVDVLTLSCMSGPDEGIGAFAKFAVAHNPHIRITLQELWLPEDRFPFDPLNRTRKSNQQFNDSTLADLRKPHAAYFKSMEDCVRALNRELGRQTVFIVPDAQATLALRARIVAGTAPGIGEQADLFADPWGHPRPPLQLLAAYCHFAVIYRRNPLGLPLPSPDVFSQSWPEKRPWRTDELNRLLQELAWDAVCQHPLSGVRANRFAHEDERHG